MDTLPCLQQFTGNWPYGQLGIGIVGRRRPVARTVAMGCEAGDFMIVVVGWCGGAIFCPQEALKGRRLANSEIME